MKDLSGDSEESGRQKSPLDRPVAVDERRPSRPLMSRIFANSEFRQEQKKEDEGFRADYLQTSGNGRVSHGACPSRSPGRHGRRATLPSIKSS
jgi:hypothetical protein